MLDYLDGPNVITRVFIKRLESDRKKCDRKAEGKEMQP